jgi:hypothetical protein
MALIFLYVTTEYLPEPGSVPAEFWGGYLLGYVGDYLVFPFEAVFSDKDFAGVWVAVLECDDVSPRP